MYLIFSDQAWEDYQFAGKQVETVLEFVSQSLANVGLR